jgi:hypothetical protein
MENTISDFSSPNHADGRPHRRLERGRSRAETDRVLGEAHKLFDQISNMLTEMRRELLGRR